MTDRVKTTDRAQRDFEDCYSYIAQRSQRGAFSWANAFDTALADLDRVHTRSLAPESTLVDDEIFQRFFKTRHGLKYRLLYIQRDNLIYVIHVRGPGQDLMTSDEINLPNDSGQ